MARRWKEEQTKIWQASLVFASPSQVFCTHHDNVFLTSFFVCLFTYTPIVLGKSIYVHAYFSKHHASSETDAIVSLQQPNCTDLVTTLPKNVTRVLSEVLELTLWCFKHTLPPMLLNTQLNLPSTDIHVWCWLATLCYIKIYDQAIPPRGWPQTDCLEAIVPF